VRTSRRHTSFASCCAHRGCGIDTEYTSARSRRWCHSLVSPRSVSAWMALVSRRLLHFGENKLIMVFMLFLMRCCTSFNSVSFSRSSCMPSSSAHLHYALGFLQFRFRSPDSLRSLRVRVSGLITRYLVWRNCAALRIVQVDSARRLLEQSAIEFTALQQRMFGLFAIGDIHRKTVNDRLIIVHALADETVGQPNPVLSAVLIRHSTL